MNRRRKTNRVFSLPVALAALAVLLAALGVGVRHWRGVLADHWRGQLATAPDDQIEARLHQIARLGDEGIAVLVEALASDRESVASGSRAELSKAVDRWKLLRSRQSSPKVALLARHLARQAERMSPSTKRFAADLATQILLWPLDRETVDATGLIADCESVLQAAAGDASVVLADSASPSGPSDGRWPSAMPDARATAGDVALVGAALDDLPGGDLPIEVVDVPSLPSWLVEPGQSDVPRRFVPAESPSPVDAATRREPPPSLGEFPSDVAPLARSPGSTQDGPSSPVRTSLPNAADYRALARLEDLEVIRLLRDGRSVVESAAGRELRRRGFRAIHFPLAMRLTDPDPQRRRELAELLPGMSGVDARPWLRWLSRDEDPQVRLTAVTIMATSRDPQLLEYLRQLPQHESDPAILRQVERLLQNRSR